MPCPYCIGSVPVDHVGIFREFASFPGLPSVLVEVGVHVSWWRKHPQFSSQLHTEVLFVVIITGAGRGARPLEEGPARFGFTQEVFLGDKQCFPELHEFFVHCIGRESEGRLVGCTQYAVGLFLLLLIKAIHDPADYQSFYDFQRFFLF